MAQSVWDAQQNQNNQIDRDTFDWTHANNFTAEFGTIYPIFSRLMPQNSKIKIRTDLGLQLLPMSFPVQTPMKCKVSFYKVPLRTLWDGYMDYVGNFKQGLEEPYHDIPDRFFNDFYGECKLADYIEIPNILFGTFGANFKQLYPTIGNTDEPYLKTLVPFKYYNDDGSYTSPFIGSTLITDDSFTEASPFNSSSMTISFGHFGELSNKLTNSFNYKIDNLANSPLLLYYYSKNENSLGEIQVYAPSQAGLSLVLYDENKTIIGGTNLATLSVVEISDLSERYPNAPSPLTNQSVRLITGIPETINFTLDNIEASVLSNVAYYSLNIDFNFGTNATSQLYELIPEVLYNPLNEIISLDANPFNEIKILNVDDAGTSEWSVITPSTSPYYSSQSNPKGKKLKAYRARAYEAIYNAYIRDPRNNPLLDSQGNPVYNYWLLNKKGGADTYPYPLHRENWEKDFLTTAVQSPQQGVAPLVGLTQYINSDNGLNYNLSLVDEDGNKYKVEYTLNDNQGVKSYTISVGDKLPDNTNILQINPKEQIDNYNIGMSILDFRMVNAYQKYLELNIRKGYSYKDIIEGRFDCRVRFDELQMPEFLGGFTRDIQMNRVVQAVDNNVGLDAENRTYERSLGSLGGDAYFNTPNAQEITCFCDEECIIMGILRVVPLPVYSQLLPKDFLYNDILDHFQPEFNNIGMQPITYAEVCPLQAKLFGVDLDDTFGYQRAWYEYVYANDTSHGLMRTYFRDFLMNRHFKEVPKLNKSFLLVDPDQLNDVFQVPDDGHKIIGQAVFSITTELPVNRVQIPRID